MHYTASLLSVPGCSPQYVSRLVTNYEANWKKENIELVKGLATFDDAQTVRVKLNAGGERVIKASKVLVAVGGRPAMPEDVPGTSGASPFAYNYFFGGHFAPWCGDRSASPNSLLVYQRFCVWL